MWWPRIILFKATKVWRLKFKNLWCKKKRGNAPFLWSENISLWFREARRRPSYPPARLIHSRKKLIYPDKQVSPFFFVIAITSLTALLGLKSTTVTIHRARLMVWGLILEQVPHQAAADDDHPRCKYSHQLPLIKEQMFQRLFGALGSTVHLTHSWGNGGLWRPESLWEVSNKPKNSGLGDCNFNVPMGTWSPKDPNFYEIVIGMSLSFINYRISIKKWSMSTQVF